MRHIFLLFHEWSVPLILAGVKTETRRIRGKGYRRDDLVHCKTAFLGSDFALVRMTADERQESLWDITPAGVAAEGVAKVHMSEMDFCWGLYRFANLWDSINTQPSTQWYDNPEVYVYEFELVENRLGR